MKAVDEILEFLEKEMKRYEHYEAQNMLTGRENMADICRRCALAIERVIDFIKEGEDEKVSNF